MKAEALALHRRGPGKLAVVGTVGCATEHDLNLAYSPGVAEPCRRIAENEDLVYDFTIKGNTVAVVSDGSAVLGLGDIGPKAALPVMEGKALLLKTFAGVDTVPLVISSQNADDVVQAVELVSPTFGAINLEDISAPRCFDIERRLRESLDIPVFHDDQHGTAIVMLAGLVNALKVVGKSLDQIKVVVEGAGASGLAVTRLLLNSGVSQVTVLDSRGIIFPGREAGMNAYKEEVAQLTNSEGRWGGLEDAMQGADVFIELSAADTVSPAMVRSMAAKPIIFACANPDPQIWPEHALAAGASVVGTGRSDYPNQINNVLAFPGLLRGALDVRARDITQDMLVAAAGAIADLVSPAELSADHVIPNALDKRVAPAVAEAVAQAAMAGGQARVQVAPGQVGARCRALVG